MPRFYRKWETRILRFSICLQLCIPAFVSAFTQDENVKQKRILVLYENGGHHKAFTDRAIPWLQRLAKDSSLELELITDIRKINTSLLRSTGLFLQLDYPPYGWPETSQQAFIKYILDGGGGWIGLHHAGLVGSFDGFPMWDWYKSFLGNIEYKNYIPDFASGVVVKENSIHPVMRGIADTFTIFREEWYIWNTSPRPAVHVLASVHENSYSPRRTVTMGDHPVVWTNGDVNTKNVYIFMGHDPGLFDNRSFVRLLTNAIFWSLTR